MDIKGVFISVLVGTMFVGVVLVLTSFLSYIIETIPDQSQLVFIIMLIIGFSYYIYINVFKEEQDEEETEQKEP